MAEKKIKKKKQLNSINNKTKKHNIPFKDKKKINNFNNRFDPFANFTLPTVVPKVKKKYKMFNSDKNINLLRFFYLRKFFNKDIKNYKADPQYKHLKRISKVIKLIKNKSKWGVIFFSRFNKKKTKQLKIFLKFYIFFRKKIVNMFRKFFKTLKIHIKDRKKNLNWIYQEDDDKDEIAIYEKEYKLQIFKDFIKNLKKVYATILFNLRTKKISNQSMGLIFFFSKLFNFYFFNKLSNFLMKAGRKTKSDNILVEFLKRLQTKYNIKNPFDNLKLLLYKNLIPAIRTRQVGRKTIKILGSKASFYYRVNMSLKLFIKGAYTHKTSIVQALILEYFKLCKGVSKLHTYNKDKLEEIQKHRLFTKVF